MSENIEKGITERAAEKIKGMMLGKNQKLFKGRNTGAKIMAHIDASNIIAHSYLNILETSVDDEPEDIFDKKKIERSFIKAACLVDPKKYAKILLIENKWANFEYKLNLQEYFKKDPAFLKTLDQINEKKDKDRKGIFSKFFKCSKKIFKKKSQIHVQDATTAAGITTDKENTVLEDLS